ncbi:hypothetical protein JOB18_002565 [Solea senegalensis]|uniref:Uncharacterized protein n=1 Tax=Solea senegalensis TaxID=28829 RepID=A0AAV6PA40_SOLSE|nr:hypothetical protein JOB18_002565 [Solea senegalensis]
MRCNRNTSGQVNPRTCATLSIMAAPEKRQFHSTQRRNQSSSSSETTRRLREPLRSVCEVVEHSLIQTVHTEHTPSTAGGWR